MGYRTALFDFDGTLADTKQCSIVATRKTFEHFGFQVPTDERIMAGMGIPLEVDLPKMIGRTFSERVLDEILDVFRNFYQESEQDTIRSFPHIPEILSALKNSGVSIALVTSKSAAVAKRNVGQLQLGRWLDTMVCFGDSQTLRPKPAPDGVYAALKKLGDPSPDDSIMIGDAIYDVQMGQAAGIRTCAVTWGSGSDAELKAADPDYLLDRPEELETVILEAKSTSRTLHF